MKDEGDAVRLSSTMLMQAVVCGPRLWFGGLAWRVLQQASSLCVWFSSGVALTPKAPLCKALFFPCE